MRRALPAAAALALVALTACALFWPLVGSALGPERRFLEWDVPEQYWPDLVYLCGALHQGELPYWNPHDRGGYPYDADPQAGTYHPASWAICALAGPSPPLGWAEARVVFGFFLAGAFGLLWLRRYGLPWGAALLGATAIQAAPFMRHNWELNLTAALAYLPLMLWAADRLATERRPRDAAALALALALCAWTGSPPALWLAGTFTAALLGARLVGEARREGRRALGRALAASALAAALAAGLTLVVLVPAARLVPHSVQAGRSFESIAEGGLSLDWLSALVLQRPGNHLYVGLLVLALAPLGLLAARRAAAGAVPSAWLHAGLALLAVLLSLGASTPVFGLAFDLVPGVAAFRLPHRYEAWLGPALGLLAASGLAFLGSAAPAAWLLARRRPLRLLAGLSAGLALVAWQAGLPAGPATLLGGVAVVAAAATVSRLGAAHLATGALLSALLLADLAAGLPPGRHTRPGPPPCGEGRAVLARAPGTDRAFRYWDELGVGCRSGSRLGRRDLRGYQDPLILRAAERTWAALAESPRLLEQLNVRYVLSGPHFLHGEARHYVRPERLLEVPGLRDRGLGVLELPSPLPAAYFVGASGIERAADRPAALGRLRRLAPAAVAILDGAASPPGAPLPAAGAGPAAAAGPVVAARGYRLDRDSLSFEIDAPAEGVVVVNETFYPGWRAWVDGEPAAVFRANGLVRAVPVGPGRRRVEMRYRPASGPPLRLLLVASLLASLALLLPLGRRARERPEPPAEARRPPRRARSPKAERRRQGRGRAGPAAPQAPPRARSTSSGRGSSGRGSSGPGTKPGRARTCSSPRAEP